jgi:hypothetical protein
LLPRFPTIEILKQREEEGVVGAFFVTPRVQVLRPYPLGFDLQLAATMCGGFGYFLDQTLALADCFYF